MPKILAFILLTIHAAFAQPDPCKDETQKAEILYDMCAKIDPQSASYMECVKLYMEQKNKSSEVCNAAPLAPAIVPAPAPTVVPAPVAAALPPAVSLAQALSASGLSGGCVEDFTNILKKDGFSMANFVKELPPSVAKVKLQLKSPFGKPKDSEKTSVGLTVGCIKALPESPAELQTLLKNIALKAGLDFAMGAAANLIHMIKGFTRLRMQNVQKAISHETPPWGRCLR